jgi:hypothetical protein
MNNNGTNTRAATMPTIHHYNGDGDEEDPQTQYQYNVASTTINTSSAAGGFRGDASWRPNTGETNVYDTAIFGLALHELLDNLALTNVCSGAATCLLLAATWFFKLLALRNLVLSCYLAFFGFTLLSVELLHMFRIDRGYFMSIQTLSSAWKNCLLLSARIPVLGYWRNLRVRVGVGLLWQCIHSLVCVGIVSRVSKTRYSSRR